MSFSLDLSLVSAQGFRGRTCCSAVACTCGQEAAARLFLCDLPHPRSHPFWCSLLAAPERGGAGLLPAELIALLLQSLCSLHSAPLALFCFGSPFCQFLLDNRPRVRLCLSLMLSQGFYCCNENKHHDQKHPGEERVYLAYTSPSLSIIESSQSRNS